MNRTERLFIIERRLQAAHGVVVSAAHLSRNRNPLFYRCESRGAASFEAPASNDSGFARRAELTKKNALNVLADPVRRSPCHSNERLWACGRRRYSPPT